MASVDLTPNAFKKYCERAFERYFNNEERAIQTCDLYELLCNENIFKKQYVKEIIDLFDEDNSDSVQYKELIKIFIENLGYEVGLTEKDIKKHINQRFEIELKSDSEGE